MPTAGYWQEKQRCELSDAVPAQTEGSYAELPLEFESCAILRPRLSQRTTSAISTMSDSVIEVPVEAVSQQTAPLDAPQEVMAALYTAALGPVNLMYYLNLFSRYDSIKQSGLGWNWAAALCTLPWMAFRQLWGPALIYVAAIEGLALLGLGFGRNVLHWSAAIEWVFITALVITSILGPGLYGNAMVHSETRKKIHKALASTRTIPDAYDALLQQASGWKRLTTTVACACAATALAAIALIVWPPSDIGVALGHTASGSASAPLVLNATPTAAEELSAQRALAATNVTASNHDAGTALSNTTTAPAITSTPDNTVSEPTTPPATSPIPTTSNRTTPIADAVDAAPTANAPTTQPTNPSPAAGDSVVEKTTPKPPLAQNPKTSRAKVLAPETTNIGQAPGYYINVGLFAQPSNARVTQSRLLNEGLPAFRQSVGTGTAARTRVRVGPYVSRPQAEDAARKIKSMGLDSLIFQQFEPAKSP